MPDLDETIVAHATARDGALRGIIRLSGPDAWRAATAVFQPPLHDPAGEFHPTAVSGELTLPGLSRPVPATLLLGRAPRSYTGQDLVEIHTLGSPPILQCLLDTLIAAGARPALPGEFTMRAFLHGKLDLTEAEAILGLIDATNPAQAGVALRQLAGGIARPIQQIRDQLLDLLAELEAGLDFAEEDLQFIDQSSVRSVLESAAVQIDQMQLQMEQRSTAIDRQRVVLLGKPNAGKSALFNALVGRTAAMVSDSAGTTRDYLIAPLHLASTTVELIDTAGIEHATDDIASAAQSARERSIESAGLAIWCRDSTSTPTAGSEFPGVETGIEVIIAYTKRDLAPPNRLAHECVDAASVSPNSTKQPVVRNVIEVSAFDGTGLSRLRQMIDEWAGGDGAKVPSVVPSTAARCSHAIRTAARSLRGALEQVRVGSSNEFVAFEIRQALEELGQVVGAVYTDDILDRIFSRFCIGK